MALSIKNPEAEALAKEVAESTGETRTQAVITALAERLERLRGRRAAPSIFEAIMGISRHCSSLPELDPRSPDEILGYSRNGNFDAE